MGFALLSPPYGIGPCFAPKGFANLFQIGASTAADAARRSVNKAPVYRGKAPLEIKSLTACVTFE